MSNEQKSALILGIFLAAGLIAASWIGGNSALRFKEYERAVSVKGLSERDVPADIAVWPIQFTAASNDLTALYASMEENTKQILEFLKSSDFTDDEITSAAPAITDKFAEQYGAPNVNLRYTAKQTITVYSTKIDTVRSAQQRVAELGKKGIALGGQDYNQRTQFLFTKLNDIKPAMIEEATQKARLVAEQFAADSHSRIGKLKSANQGQFTIEDRDSNTPYLKRVRVVSTVEYYLAD